MTRRVLVTRPEPGASATAARLFEWRFAPVVLPLTRIEAVIPPAMPRSADFDAVAVTSSNALRHAPPALIETFAAHPVFAVGERTAGRTMEAGFRTIRATAEDADSLADAVRAASPAGTRILYLAGALRDPEFETALASSGFAVEALVVYDAPEIVYSSDEVLARTGSNPIWGALVYSSRGGKLLAELARRPALADLFRDTTWLCISQKAAAPLEPIAGGRIAVSDSPDEAGVLALPGRVG